VLDDLRVLARLHLRQSVDRLIASPLLRWSWSGSDDRSFTGNLVEFRPTDRDSARELAEGRFLLAGRIVDAGDRSPFLLNAGHPEWRLSLHGFAWLRHFRDVRDKAVRQTARALVLDWIGRSRSLPPDLFTPTVTARRVMNWLRHYDLLIEGATMAQITALNRSLDSQSQVLALRGPLAPEPEARLLAATALLGLALCSKNTPNIPDHVTSLDVLLTEQIDADGLHKSRNPQLQLQLLIELITVHHALLRHNGPLGARLAKHLGPMGEALSALTLASGELALFNGAAPVPRDLLNAVLKEGPKAQRRSRVFSGYGVLVSGRTTIIAESGLIPPLEFAAHAHMGALGFEMSHGGDVIFGNCGPAPSDHAIGGARFRHGVAHSAPTINGQSAALLPERGLFSGRPRPLGAPGAVEVDPKQHVLLLRTGGFAQGFGVTLERRIALLSGGVTLVGQDRMIATGRLGPRGTITCRFHLGPGVATEQWEDERMVILRLANGSAWSFLWEGAEMRIEDSVRRSNAFGFSRTRQIVLEAPVASGAEIAWIATREGR
jgi:uncharacterized heparinase superfamily protein